MVATYGCSANGVLNIHRVYTERDTLEYLPLVLQPASMGYSVCITK